MSTCSKRAATKDELLAIGLLGGVRYPVASFDKRFNRDVLQPILLVHAPEHIPQISDKAAAQLWRLFIRYRRQFSHPDKDRLLRFAADHAAPDFRKVQAAQNEQARIDALKAQHETHTP